VLEHEVVDTPAASQRLMELASFRELVHYF
jgi:hypothetical protein